MIITPNVNMPHGPRRFHAYMKIDNHCSAGLSRISIREPLSAACSGLRRNDDLDSGSGPG